MSLICLCNFCYNSIVRCALIWQGPYSLTITNEISFVIGKLTTKITFLTNNDCVNRYNSDDNRNNAGVFRNKGGVNRNNALVHGKNAAFSQITLSHVEKRRFLANNAFDRRFTKDNDCVKKYQRN